MLQRMLSRWVPNSVCAQVNHPSPGGFSCESISGAGSAPVWGISRDGCLCVQGCRSFASTCSSPGVLARGKAPVCQKRGASAGHHWTVMDRAVLSIPISLSTLLSSVFRLSPSLRLHSWGLPVAVPAVKPCPGTFLHSPTLLFPPSLAAGLL